MFRSPTYLSRSLERPSTLWVKNIPSELCILVMAVSSERTYLVISLDMTRSYPMMVWRSVYLKMSSYSRMKKRAMTFLALCLLADMQIRRFVSSFLDVETVASDLKMFSSNWMSGSVKSAFMTTTPLSSLERLLQVSASFSMIFT